MVINDVYELSAFIFKKEKSGYFNPEQFNIAIKSASRDLFDSKYRIFEDTQNVVDALRPFISVVGLNPSTTTGLAGLPDNYRHKILIYESNNYTPVDWVKGEHWAYRFNSKVVGPDADHPICRLKNGNFLEFAPKGGEYEMQYFTLDEPDIEWAYTSPNGVPVWDEGNSIDVLWDEEQIEELTHRVLLQFGISLKDADISGYAQAMQQREIP